MSVGSTGIAWICSERRVNPVTRVEENRPRWGARLQIRGGQGACLRWVRLPLSSANTARSFWPRIAVAVEKAKKTAERGLLTRRSVIAVTLAHAKSCYLAIKVWREKKFNGYNERQNPWSNSFCSRPQSGACTIRRRDAGQRQ